jgi:hypothetical protein
MPFSRPHRYTPAPTSTAISALSSSTAATDRSPSANQSSSSFRPSVWDPAFIIAQIVCLQTSTYFAFSILVFFADILYGLEPNLNQLFHHEQLGFRTGFHLMLTLLYLASSGFGYLFIACYILYLSTTSYRS